MKKKNEIRTGSSAQRTPEKSKFHEKLIKNVRKDDSMCGKQCAKKT